jgi:hypothetical protein
MGHLAQAGVHVFLAKAECCQRIARSRLTVGGPKTLLHTPVTSRVCQWTWDWLP